MLKAIQASLEPLPGRRSDETLKKEYIAIKEGKNPEIEIKSWMKSLKKSELRPVLKIQKQYKEQHKGGKRTRKVDRRGSKGRSLQNELSTRRRSK